MAERIHEMGTDRANFSPNLNSEPELIPGNGQLIDRARDPHPKQVCRNLVEGPHNIQFLDLFAEGGRLGIRTPSMIMDRFDGLHVRDTPPQ